MTSERKRKSNQKNSRNSSGPRTSRGKSHARFNALDTGAYRDPRILSEMEAARLKWLRLQVWDEFNPVGILEDSIADELSFNYLRRERVEWSERRYYDKVHGMELGRLEESLTLRERILFVEIMAKRHPAGRVAVPDGERYAEKIPGPPETDEEIIKRLEYRIAKAGELPHLIEHGHLGLETKPIKEHLDRQRRAIFKDILANIAALKQLQSGRLTSKASERVDDGERIEGPPTKRRVKHDGRIKRATERMRRQPDGSRRPVNGARQSPAKAANKDDGSQATTVSDSRGTEKGDRSTKLPPEATATPTPDPNVEHEIWSDKWNEEQRKGRKSR